MSLRASVPIQSPEALAASLAGLLAALNAELRSTGSTPLSQSSDHVEVAVPDQLLGNVPVGLRGFSRLHLTIHDGPAGRVLVARARLRPLQNVLLLGLPVLVLVAFPGPGWARALAALALGLLLLAIEYLYFTWYLGRLVARL